MKSPGLSRGRRIGMDGRRISFPTRLAASKARSFAESSGGLGVKQRFGAIGRKGSMALIERLWRTLKDTLGLRLIGPLVAEDLIGASVGDPASSRKAGRRPDRLTVLRRVPRYGAAAARVG